MLFLRLLGQAALRFDDGRELPTVLAQPKRLALLAYLAAARPVGFHRRDTLLGLFWPDLDQERGRAALRQSLYTLRQALGADAIVTRGDGEVGIASGVLTCDVVQFRDGLATDPAGAFDLYGGDLLNGFFIPDAPEFERWLEEERWLLRREAAAAAWRVAELAREEDPSAAASWAARAAALDPFNEEAVRRLMTLLASGGHRASALQVYQNFARLLERELETAPSDETRALAASLRVTPANGNGNGHGLATLDIDALPALKQKRPFPIRAVAVGLLLIIAMGTYRLVSANRSAGETIAVGVVSGDPLLRDMLATSLARIEGVSVVSNTRLVELARGDTSAVAVVRAARRANAGRLLEGRLQRDESGVHRLTLHWLNPDNGRVERAIQVEERSLYALVDAATTEFAQSLSLTPPAVRFASVTTRSLRAYRLYEEGLRSLHRNERTTAERLLKEAVTEDSTFAIAQWYYSRLHDQDFEHVERALRHADRATDRERLFIKASFLSQMDDPATAAVAETLAIRYPAEPDGHFLLGYARMWGGDPLGAIPHFRKVVKMDTASLSDGNAARCRACDALGEIGTALALADSGAAVLRLAREWVRIQPRSRGAWNQMAGAYDMAGMKDEALNARRMANSVPPADYADINHTETLIRAGDVAAADAILLDRIHNGDAAMRENAQFKYSLSLRTQGRYQEALRAARAFRGYASGPNRIFSANPEAYVLLEMGRARAAAALFDSIAAHAFTPLSRARNARAVIGGLARSAEAYAAVGDTIALKRAIATMTDLSRHTAFAPAREQHHHARGLLLHARGDHAGAAREFEAAFVFPGNLWTRTHYRLAQERMEIGKPREAAEVLGAALRSTIGGAGYGLTHRELHRLAADAWRTAGNPDSATVHEQWGKKARTKE